MRRLFHVKNIVTFRAKQWYFGPNCSKSSTCSPSTSPHCRGDCTVCLSGSVTQCCAPLSPQTLYERCDRLRPSLFRLASDTTDDDEALAQILAANDELTLVINAYKGRVERRESNGERERSRNEEETEGKNSGRSFLSLLAVPVENTLTLLLALLCSSCMWSCLSLFLQLQALPERSKAITSSTCLHWTPHRLTEKLTHHWPLNPLPLWKLPFNQQLTRTLMNWVGMPFYHSLVYQTYSLLKYIHFVKVVWERSHSRLFAPIRKLYEPISIIYLIWGGLYAMTHWGMLKSRQLWPVYLVADTNRW